MPLSHGIKHDVFSSYNFVLFFNTSFWGEIVRGHAQFVAMNSAVNKPPPPDKHNGAVGRLSPDVQNNFFLCFADRAS